MDHYTLLLSHIPDRLLDRARVSPIHGADGGVLLELHARTYTLTGTVVRRPSLVRIMILHSGNTEYNFTASKGFSGRVYAIIEGVPEELVGEALKALVDPDYQCTGVEVFVNGM